MRKTENALKNKIQKQDYQDRVISLTKSGFYRKDLKGSYISRSVENTNLNLY